jgi:uncharacterized protein
LLGDRGDLPPLRRPPFGRRGSAARLVDFEPERSDVDFVVAFEPAARPSLGEFFALREALAAAGGRLVDLVVEGKVRNPFIRGGIERSETVYGP